MTRPRNLSHDQCNQISSHVLGYFVCIVLVKIIFALTNLRVWEVKFFSPGVTIYLKIYLSFPKRSFNEAKSILILGIVQKALWGHPKKIFGRFVSVEVIQTWMNGPKLILMLRLWFKQKNIFRNRFSWSLAALLIFVLFYA